jgi:hypothetical protein
MVRRKDSTKKLECSHTNDQLIGEIVIVGLKGKERENVIGSNEYQGKVIAITSNHITLNPGARADELAHDFGIARSYYLHTQLPWVASFELGIGKDRVIPKGNIKNIWHYTQGLPLERQREFNSQLSCGDVNLEKLFNPPTEDEIFKEAVVQHTREYQRLIEEGRDPKEIIDRARQGIKYLFASRTQKL